MNKYLLSLLMVLGIAFTGCQKLVDYYNIGENVESPNCQVTIIDNSRYKEDQSYETSIHVVHYNSAGLPEYVWEYYTKDFDVLGDQNMHLYDDQNRLIQEGALSDQSPYRYRYIYEGDSPVPVRDTLYTIGKVYVEDFEYDQQGRIIRVLRRLISNADKNSPKEPDVDLRYYYDIRGNRQENPSNIGYNGLIQYSDKPSLYSLHPVWKLRYRDFSKNSTSNADTYNDKGLPIMFSETPKNYFQPFLNAAPGAMVEYICE